MGRSHCPLFGDVSAVGRSTSQLKDEISPKLRAYMETPTVSIMVSQINCYAIYVMCLARWRSPEDIL
jgi:protein involved in polysaccharide export with SLBB domain